MPKPGNRMTPSSTDAGPADESGTDGSTMALVHGAGNLTSHGSALKLKASKSDAPGSSMPRSNIST